MNENRKSLMRAISVVDNPAMGYKYYFADVLAVGYMHIDGPMTPIAFEHSHDEYEFIIPYEPNPYLTNESAVYFGEVGYVYPVQSGRVHGIKFKLDGIHHADIAINKDFFESVLKEKGHEGFEFNNTFKESDNLRFLLSMFKSEVSKEPKDMVNKIAPIVRLICSEIIDCAVIVKGDDRKRKADYQPGMYSVAEYINNHFNEELTIEGLAEMCGLSENYFSSSFRNAIGDSPGLYIRKLRISKAKILLETTNLPIKEISEKCGFKRLNSFTGAFKGLVGASPSEYRKQFHK